VAPAYTRTAEFRVALNGVLDHSGSRTVAVLRSESGWWRRYRRLITEAAMLPRPVRSGP
jgi:hypothetical protein